MWRHLYFIWSWNDFIGNFPVTFFEFMGLFYATYYNLYMYIVKEIPLAFVVGYSYSQWRVKKSLTNFVSMAYFSVDKKYPN